MKEKRNEQKETGLLTFLYKNPVGRMLLKILTLPVVSSACGWGIKSFLSRGFIDGYIRRHGIDMSRFEETKYRSFNDFFTRELATTAFLEKGTQEILRAPCDGKLSVYPITKDCCLSIKNSVYTISDLLGDSVLAESYSDGTCLIFRLTPDDYHRYCFIDDGEILSQKVIKGVLHTVRPIACSNYPVFVQNSRVSTVMQTKHFDAVSQIEVGALLVGKIRNHKSQGSFCFGEEKGYFEFGGSTVILLVKKGILQVDETIKQAMEGNTEHPLQIGEIIGSRGEGSEATCESQV